MVFADTFYWIALTLPGDADYQRAQEFTGDIVTTEEALTEYLTFFCGSPEYLRREVANNVDAILIDPTVHVSPQSHDSFLAGLALYRSRPDKGYSLTDCISMEAMRKAAITEVLTNDKHFEQEVLYRAFSEIVIPITSLPGCSLPQPLPVVKLKSPVTTILH